MVVFSREEVRRVLQEGILLEVEHVQAHRTKKEKQDMTLFERFVTEGDERADELAKDGSMTDGAEMAPDQNKHSPATKRGGFTRHCSTQLACAVWWRNRATVRSSNRNLKTSALLWIRMWKAKYRCMRCGRSSKKMQMQGACEGPRWLGKDFKRKLRRWSKTHSGEHDVVRRVDPNGEALVWCRKCLGCVRCRVGPKLMNQWRPGNKDTREDG